MNDAIADNSPIEAPAAAPQQLSPGVALARRRLERGLSLEDVAQHLKFGVRQITALEEDDFSKLPGATFVRGMIRSYAKLLDMDAAPLLQELGRREIPAPATVYLRTTRIPFPDGAKRSTRVYAALSVLVVLAALAVAYEWQTGSAPWSAGTTAPVAQRAPVAVPEPLAPPALPAENRASPPAVVGSTSVEPAAAVPPPATVQGGKAAGVAVTVPPAVAKAAEAFPAAQGNPTAVRVPVSGAAGKARLVLQFQQESWVEVKQADGRILLSQMNRGGSEQEVGGTPPFDVVIGNAPSVRLFYNGQSVDLRPHYKVDVARLILE